MSTPSSRHLSHDYPAFKGLTLRELMVLVLLTISVMVLLCTLLGFCLGFPGALGCLGLVIGFIVGICLAPKPISRLKAGKPHGYMKKKITMKLAKFGLIQTPYLIYCGPWHTSKKLGARRV